MEFSNITENLKRFNHYVLYCLVRYLIISLKVECIMCGICGFVDKMHIEDKELIVNKMMNKIIHRGPDDARSYVDTGIALGFRRLSIIDLEEGMQPIFNEDESLILVFNGEIYNYKDIKKDLLAKGHQFKTKTDSEVILHCYEEYGTDLFQHLRGMFAFVIWDKKTNTLFGARDFFGIKPFYYANSNGSFVFASEIKSIIEHPTIEKKSESNGTLKLPDISILTLNGDIFRRDL